MKISNVKFLDENFQWQYGSVEFDKQISEISISNSDEQSEFMLVPGFIDIHTHGCAGFDTCDNNLDGYEEMAKFHAKNGVTSFLLTTMTTPKAEIVATLEKAKEYMAESRKYSYVQGVYLEGPFICEKKKGAQSAEAILPPDFEVFADFYSASGGNIKVVVCAPEVAGAIDFAKKASELCRVSIAHTNAKYEQAMAGIEAGFSSATHFFNAMTNLEGRSPGVVGAVYDSDVYCELICDGFHVHEASVRNTFKIKGRDRIMLISDSTQAYGMPNGQYILGGQKVFHTNGAVFLADGVIAGSASKVLNCVKNCISWGIPSEDAFKAASGNPAEFIGAYDKTGSIKVGKFADLVLLDRDMNVLKTFIKGEEYSF